MINIDVPYQTNEMCGYRTVGVSDSNALWSPNVFGSISQTKDFHPRACVRKQETKNDDKKKNPTSTRTHSRTVLHSPLGITMLMEDGHAASMKSRSRGLSRCRTGSSCLTEEIHMDMGRSSACFFTLKPNKIARFNRN